MNKEHLWEILVPYYVNGTNDVIDISNHKIWDEYVKGISKGLTVCRSAKGIWINPTDNEEFEERMIPVRLICTRPQIIEIIDFTKKHYGQIAVMAYKISEDIIIR
jgi:hypothetical protein